MRNDVKLWWAQSEKDFENAKKNFDLKEYYLVAFLVQQALEKGLKAYFLFKEEDFAEKTHSLVYLGKRLDLPNKLLSGLRKVNPDFVFTRYPDMDGVAPYEAYDEEIAIERLEIGEEVLKWIRKQMLL